MNAKAQPPLQSVRFFVDETPYACWELDLVQRNRDFLAGLDPSYYEYVAHLNAAQLEDENHRQQAALALRIAYSQALETFFALIGAFVQAPRCVYGWMLRYRPRELKSLIRKISQHDAFPTVFPEQPSWDQIAEHVTDHLDYDDDKKRWIREGFAGAWKRFADDFLDEKQSDEYNSAKHGLRTRLGGFTLAFGPEKIPGQPAAPEDMRSLGGSMFGARFYTIEWFDKINFRGRRLSRNWVPMNHCYGLLLLAMSMQNVISTLRGLTNDSGERLQFSNPDTPDGFHSPWARHPGVSDFKMDYNLKREHIEPFSAADVAAAFSRNAKV